MLLDIVPLQEIDSKAFSALAYMYIMLNDIASE